MGHSAVLSSAETETFVKSSPKQPLLCFNGTQKESQWQQLAAFCYETHMNEEWENFALCHLACVSKVFLYRRLLEQESTNLQTFAKAYVRSGCTVECFHISRRHAETSSVEAIARKLDKTFMFP